MKSLSISRWSLTISLMNDCLGMRASLQSMGRIPSADIRGSSLVSVRSFVLRFSVAPLSDRQCGSTNTIFVSHKFCSPRFKNYVLSSWQTSQ